MPDNIKITIEGQKELEAALRKFPLIVKRYLQAAGAEASKRVVLPTVGLKEYPSETAANQPPAPYYIRGRGTQYAHRNAGNSERLGTQWYTKAQGTGTYIGNRASYGPYVVGEEQASHMAAIGWRRLIDVVEEKIGDITKVYQAWVDKLLKECGLK